MNQSRYSTRSSVLPEIHVSRLMIFGALIMVALVAFEIFNYTTTEYSLRDLLGNLRFAGIQWATILAIAFCGIDFAGLARMFTPEVGAQEPREVWYLFGAWMLAAIMNAMLTWWGVSVAISDHKLVGNGLVTRATLIHVVPVFVAIMVWLIRVLIIGTFSVTGDRLFGKGGKGRGYSQSIRTPTWQPQAQTQTRPARSLATKPASFNRPSPFRYTENMTRPSISSRPTQTAMNPIYNPAPRTTPTTPAEPELENEFDSTYQTSDPVYVPVGMTKRNTAGHNPLKL